MSVNSPTKPKSQEHLTLKTKIVLPNDLETYSKDKIIELLKEKAIKYEQLKHKYWTKMNELQKKNTSLHEKLIFTAKATPQKTVETSIKEKQMLQKNYMQAINIEKAKRYSEKQQLWRYYNDNIELYAQNEELRRMLYTYNYNFEEQKRYQNSNSSYKSKSKSKNKKHKSSSKSKPKSSKIPKRSKNKNKDTTEKKEEKENEEEKNDKEKKEKKDKKDKKVRKKKEKKKISVIDDDDEEISLKKSRYKSYQKKLKENKKQQEAFIFKLIEQNKQLNQQVEVLRNVVDEERNRRKMQTSISHNNNDNVNTIDNNSLKDNQTFDQFL